MIFISYSFGDMYPKNSYNVAFLMLCVLHFGFQTRLLMLVWESESRSNNNSFFDFTNHYVSEIIKLFLKFYFLSTIFFVSLVKIILVEPFYLCFVFGPFLMPQIMLSIGQRKSQSPRFGLTLSATLVHISYPLYFLSYENNFLALRPQFDSLFTWVIPLTIGSLLFIALQKLFGARFFIPIRRYRKNLSLIFTDLGRLIGVGTGEA